MIVLALDTCLTVCSAAVVADGVVRAARSEPMARGHQERIAPLVREVMAEAGLAFADLDRIGVTVGPGSFTGLRVGLAFAKGLGAALDRPVIGVSVLEALAHGVDGVRAAIIDARRDQVWMQAFGQDTDGEPAALAPDAALDLLRALDRPTLVGPGAELFPDELPLARRLVREAPDPVVVATLAGIADPAPPRPLYLRAPDARLPAA